MVEGEDLLESQEIKFDQALYTSNPDFWYVLFDLTKGLFDQISSLIHGYWWT
jgi:hypothetical protein